MLNVLQHDACKAGRRMSIDPDLILGVRNALISGAVIYRKLAAPPPPPPPRSEGGQILAHHGPAICCCSMAEFTPNSSSDRSQHFIVPF